MRARSLVVLALLAATSPLAAQSVMGDMHRDVNEVQKKILDLAAAIPAEKYDWRPSNGVRSVGEVLLHVAGDNYLIPVGMGKPIPETVALKAGNDESVMAFEARKLTKEQIIAEVKASFTHLHQAMGLTTDQNLQETIKFFGQDWTRSRAMVLTVTHLHEHLGQQIAYARANNITPPWSK